MQTDVIIIGAGLAGAVAAITAQKEDARVTLIDRSFIGVGNNSAMANGAFTAPVGEFTTEKYIKSVLEVGKMINHLPTLELLAREADEAFSFLKSLGVPLYVSPAGYRVRAQRQEEIKGHLLMIKLAEQIRGSDRINTLAGFQVLELIKKDGVCCGVRGMDREGNMLSLHAPAVVLATGGAGAIYLRNDNQRSTLGQGYFLAMRAGLDLWDMEFVQFFPFVLNEPGLPSFIFYPPYPEGTRLLDFKGQDLLAKYGVTDVTDAAKRKRDEMSAMIHKEGMGGPVYIDYTKVEPGAWNEYPLAVFKRLKFDIQNKPARITPGTHFFMGGVRVDEGGQSTLPGLFCCGEMVWGAHGANRRGGNAFTDCLVRGRLTGRKAAAHALSLGPVSNVSKSEEQPFTPLASSGDMRRLKDLRTRIREIAWEQAGIVRSQNGLEKGLNELTEVEEGLEVSGYQNPMQFKLRQDLIGAALVLRAILTASLGRKESRGSFCRKEHPLEDNQNWRKNSCLGFDPDSKDFSLSFHQVPYPMEVED